MFNITGTLKVKFPEQQVSDRFRKRDIVITDNSSQYPQHITFQLTQDKCGLIDAYNPGDEIRVFFNLRGREWNDPKTNQMKYFNTIEAWKIEGVNASAGGQQQQPMQKAAPTPDMNSFSAASESDDLPF
jgi:hypothetical protein